MIHDIKSPNDPTLGQIVRWTAYTDKSPSSSKVKVRHTSKPLPYQDTYGSPTSEILQNVDRIVVLW